MPGKFRGVNNHRKPSLRTFVQILLIMSFTWTLQRADGANENEPHPHQGLLEPFAGGDPGLVLDEDALEILDSGEPYQTLLQQGAMKGRALVIQDVKAPTELVWEKILSFDKYHEMVPNTIESNTYQEESLPGRKQRMCVTMKVGFSMLSLTFFVDHVYDPARKSVTWTLDYTKRSDLDDSVGYWYVIPHPENKKYGSRVYYSVSVAMFPWVPSFVVDFMSKQALTDATGWVKKYSELSARNKGLPDRVPGRQRSKLSSASSSSSDSECSTDDQNNRFGVWTRLFQFSVVDAVHNPCGKNGYNNYTKFSSSTTKYSQYDEEDVGMMRYTLVVAVVTLALYNVHLYFAF